MTDFSYSHSNKTSPEDFSSIKLDALVPLKNQKNKSNSTYSHRPNLHVLIKSTAKFGKQFCTGKKLVFVVRKSFIDEWSCGLVW